jgi:hypothetical protein
MIELIAIDSLGPGLHVTSYIDDVRPSPLSSPSLGLYGQTGIQRFET